MRLQISDCRLQIEKLALSYTGYQSAIEPVTQSAIQSATCNQQSAMS
jgi:hypothetical protein